MAFELHRTSFPGIAASAINAGAVVTLDTTGDVQRQVISTGSMTVEPFGIALATAVNPGDGVAVFDLGNVVKGIAVASIGAGQDVNIASTGGQLGIVASGFFRVGRSVTAAAAGETFSLYVNPRRVP
jgi:hypothetical protein